MISPWDTRLVPDPTMVERIVERVRGGFQGRWLLRQVSYRPARHVLMDKHASVIVAHPTVIKQLAAMFGSSSTGAHSK